MINKYIPDQNIDCQTRFGMAEFDQFAEDKLFVSSYKDITLVIA